MKNSNEILKIYTDESSSERGRFKSICAVSGLSSDLRDLENELKKLLQDKQISELKFSEVRTHKPKIECAKSFIEKAIDYTSSGKIRIDVIIWDLHDSRHAVQGRDDKENLERMYFHLLRNIVERWEIFKCSFYPDEHSEYDYKEIIDYLNKTKYPRKEPGILKLFKEQRTKFKFIKVKQQKSENNPLIQLADLFAGVACFSREKSGEYKNYNTQNYNRQKENKGQISLLGISSKSQTESSKSTLSRFQIIEFIKELCEKKGLSVSLNTNGYLKTFNPEIPINFWHYEPQGDYDRAPTKNTKSET